MISHYYAEGPFRGLTGLDLALTPKDFETLHTIAVDDLGWERGRQEGGEYFTLSLMDQVWLHTLREVRTRLLGAIAKHAGVKPVKLQDKNDFWLIYYPEGSVGVPTHKDPAPFGAKHVRANVAVTSPETGGKLVLPNATNSDRWLEIPPSPGQGIIFSPSEAEHAVSPVGKGGRLIVSVGAIIST